MMVAEMCYSRDPKVLLALVVEDWDMCSAFLPVEEGYSKLMDLLDDDHREQPPVN